MHRARSKDRHPSRDAEANPVQAVGDLEEAGASVVGALPYGSAVQCSPGDGAGRPMLAVGSQGPAVRDLQEQLNGRGASPPLEVDGIFGGATQQAVVGFQQDNGLLVDGVDEPDGLAASSHGNQATVSRPLAHCLFAQAEPGRHLANRELAGLAEAVGSHT